MGPSGRRSIKRRDRVGQQFAYMTQARATSVVNWMKKQRWLLLCCGIAIFCAAPGVLRVIADLGRGMSAPLPFVGAAATVAAYGDILDGRLDTPLILNRFEAGAPNCFAGIAGDPEISTLDVCSIGTRLTSNDVWCAPLAGNSCLTTWIPASLFARTVFRDRLLAYLADPCELLLDYQRQVRPALARLRGRTDGQARLRVDIEERYLTSIMERGGISASCAEEGTGATGAGRHAALRSRSHQVVIFGEGKPAGAVFRVYVSKAEQGGM